MPLETRLENLVQKVQANPKYQSITPDLVRRISEDVLRKGLTGKAAVKAVRNKIHQIGGAYFKKIFDYHQVLNELKSLPKNLQAQEVKDFCIRTMQTHASTAERVPILETFFTTCLAPIQPVSSVIDLACGMNPLAMPWMPFTETYRFDACDIYLDMLRMIAEFFNHFNLSGAVHPCDLLAGPPEIKAQVAFLLKSIPCLEQVDKSISLRLMETIPAEHILVSFPVRSLGGHKKGMPDFYRDHFFTLTAKKPWEIREFVFESEIAFLVSK